MLRCCGHLEGMREQTDTLGAIRGFEVGRCKEHGMRN